MDNLAATRWLQGGEQLEKLQDFLNHFENIGDGAYAVDAGQRIIFWNETARNLLGYTLEQAQGRLCHELLAGRDYRDKPVCTVNCKLCEQARAGKPIQTSNLRVKNSRGQSVWINLSSIKFRGTLESQTNDTILHLFRMDREHYGHIPSLTIRLLGPVTVQRFDGSLIDGPFWRRAKVRALFCLLALRHNQGIHRNYLIDTLWPNMDRKAQLHNLNTCVYNLRQSIEPDLEHGLDSRYIRIQGERYLLAGGRTHWLDVEEFETNLVTARCETDQKKQIRLYQQAVDLYRGEFLSDLDAYLLDCLGERERYQQLYHVAMQGLGDLLAEEGCIAIAENLYLKIFAEDACNEKAVQALMRVFLSNGERVRALSIYQRFSEALSQKLEIQPTLQTKRLAKKAQSQK